AALQFITLLATIVFVPESRGKTQENVGAGEIIRTFKNKSISPILWQKLALSLCLYGWFGVMALYLQRQLGFTPALTDYFFSYWATLNVLTNVFLVGKVSHLAGDRRMSTFGLF